MKSQSAPCTPRLKVISMNIGDIGSRTRPFRPISEWRASFRVGKRENAVYIVEVFKNAQNARDCRILHTLSQFFFRGTIPPRTPAEASPVLGPRHQFPLGSPVGVPIVGSFNNYVTLFSSKTDPSPFVTHCHV